MWLDSVPRPDHGAGYVQRLCPDCRAGWVGTEDEGCGWCAVGLERQVADERRLLLDPPWLRQGGGRYEELGPDDRAVWDRTRGQTRGAGSVAAWEGRLARAVVAGLVSVDEAQGAIRRVRG